jgi:hypothetical protein
MYASVSRGHSPSPMRRSELSNSSTEVSVVRCGTATFRKCPSTYKKAKRSTMEKSAGILDFQVIAMVFSSRRRVGGNRLLRGGERSGSEALQVGYGPLPRGVQLSRQRAGHGLVLLDGSDSFGVGQAAGED